MTSFFDELRRRNVLRLAATYALVAWILIEAGSVLLPTFGVPEWFFRAYVIAILIGFVVSLVLAWVFEVTPDGVKFDHEVDRSAPQPRNRSRSNTIIIALLVIALGVSITFNVTGIRNQEAAANPAVVLTDHSIAVLPFTSRSTDPDNVFFADGIHDDLLTRLADIESLRVISRTSVNEYRHTTKNLRQIGAELGVDTIVEGAVQRSGDQVRITVQLIDAATDEHIWADTYDRALNISNIFHIQSDISSQIASALQAAMTPEEAVRLATIPTTSIEALSLYSAARNNLYLRRFDTLQEARRQFEQAIELDPNYAQAYAGLAETILVTTTNHGAIEPVVANELASAAIEKALEIDNQLAEAHAAQGLLLLGHSKMGHTDQPNTAAAEAFDRAIALNPNLANAYVWYSSLHEVEGRFEEAIDMLTTAMAIDPLGRIPYINLPGYYSMRGENEKAIALLIKATNIFPDWPSPYDYIARQLKGLGRLDEAVAWTIIAQSMTDDPMIGREAVGVYIEFGDTDRINAFTDKFGSDHPMYPIGVGFTHFTNNEMAEAIATFENLDTLSEMQTQVAYPMIAMASLVLEDYDKAKEYLTLAHPQLAEDTSESVNRKNLDSAIMLAYALRQTNEDRPASRLLTQAWDVVREMPRIGAAGHGISDVHILTIQGRKDAALDALRQAIDEGFVSLMSYDFWTIDQDVMLDDLRDDPRFQAMLHELHEIIDGMRRNVREAEDSGNWDVLLDRTRGELTAAVRL
jgi:TolB-like protein